MRIHWSALALGIVCFILASVSADAAALRIDEQDAVADGSGWFNWDGVLAPGATIWFDILIDDAMGQSADAAKITLTVEPVAHAGSLTFDATASSAVVTSDDYWLFGNSGGAGALTHGTNMFEFGDSAETLPPDLLENEDIVARFAFTWDGTAGDYLITIDSDTDNTYLLQNYVQEEPEVSDNPVTLYIPEPASAILFALGSLAALRRRR